VNDRPVRVVVRDDLRRSRLTVAFRLLLALFHLIWWSFWGYAVFFTSFAQWVVTVVRGRPAEPLNRFHVHYIRFTSQLLAWLTLAANPFPSLLGEPGYPIDVEIDVASRQRRLSAAFRLLLAFPAWVFVALVTFGAPNVYGGSTGTSGEYSDDPFAGSSSGDIGFVYTTGGALVAVAVLGWFVCLVRGAMPRGLRNLAAYGVRYTAEFLAYLLLVTRAYPSTDPTLPAEAGAPPRHPIRLDNDDDLRRSRLTTFFRFFLTVPHIVWLLLWSLAAFVAGVANWFVTLVRGRPARPLHRFLAAWLSYQTHVAAFVLLVANPFPPFNGSAAYPIDLAIAGPERQNRWVTGFRLPLAVPAGIVNSALSTLIVVASIAIWFVALVRGRAPDGLRNLGAYALRYSAQVNGYVFVLTDRYPYSGPPTLPADEQLALDAPL